MANNQQKEIIVPDRIVNVIWSAKIKDKMTKHLAKFGIKDFKENYKVQTLSVKNDSDYSQKEKDELQFEFDKNYKALTGEDVPNE